MEFNRAVFYRQYAMVHLFVRELAYFRGLKEGLAGVPEYRGFWPCTLNSHIKLAAVDWCKTFGSEKEDIHWKKTPTGDNADENIQNFERAMRIYTAFSKDQWEKYRRTMLAMRDTFVAHLGIKQPITEPVPLFDAALQVAYAYLRDGSGRSLNL